MGASSVGSPSVFKYKGLIPASGVLSRRHLVHKIHTEFIVVHEQAYFFDGVKEHLSNPQFSVLVDDAY